MPSSPAPIDLLREHRKVFEHEAKAWRRKEHLALSKFEKRVAGAHAYSWETGVRKIDATLRDWI